VQTCALPIYLREFEGRSFEEAIPPTGFRRRPFVITPVDINWPDIEIATALILNIDLDLVSNSTPGSDWELSDFQSIPVNRRAIQTASNPVVGPFVRFVIKLVCIADGRSVLDDEPRICGISSPEFKKDRAGKDGHNIIILLRVDPEIRGDTLPLDRYVSIMLSNRPPGCWALNPPVLGIVGHEVDKLPFRKPC